MRQLQIGSIGSPFRILAPPPRRDRREYLPSLRLRVLMMAVLGGVFAATNLAAQTAPAHGPDVRQRPRLRPARPTSRRWHGSFPGIA